MDKIQHLMDTLDITKEEAMQLLKDDDAIDHGAKLFELSADQKKVEKKMRQADRKPTVYQFKTRTRKPNDDKREIINLLADVLKDQEIEITNPERQIDFKWNGTKYRIILSAPRK